MFRSNEFLISKEWDIKKVLNYMDPLPMNKLSMKLLSEKTVNALIATRR